MWQPSKWPVGPVWVAIFSPASASVDKGGPLSAAKIGQGDNFCLGDCF